MPHTDITGIHHVGLIVADMSSALVTWRRLGFTVGAPKYPALASGPGQTPQPIGAGNTHADFRRGFIELVALAPHDRTRLPDGADLVPLTVPDEQLDATRSAMHAAVANLADRLTVGDGAHILVFGSLDAERTAERLDRAGVGHSGARSAQRPITTTDGVKLADIKFLDIDDDPRTPRGLVAEGRVGVAEDAPAALLDAQTGLRHPNGAVAVVECVVGVGADLLKSTVARYERYLGVTATATDASAVFELASGRLVVTADMPSGSTPRLSAYTVGVDDLAATGRFLTNRGVALGRRDDGRVFVPAAEAAGTDLVLEQVTH